MHKIGSLTTTSLQISALKEQVEFGQLLGVHE
jgi:hypothetical protein